MQSQWSDVAAEEYVARYGSARGSNRDVALRVYTSRLIGQTPSLVLHGGGNTSVKTQLPDDLGEPVDVLCVKGSGWDLAAIEPAGLPAVRLDSLRGLRRLPELSDEDMVNAQRIRLLNASSPNPSVETLLHAFLPHKFIDHSHADAILALVDQPDAPSICTELYGSRLAVVPYVMPGFQLAKLAAEMHEANPDAHGLLLLQHGLFTFGSTARESYERHVAAVDAAERLIASRRTPKKTFHDTKSVMYAKIAPLIRGALTEDESHTWGPWVLELRQSESLRAFLGRSDLSDVAQRGVVTPDHVIRTKNLPLLLDPEPLRADQSVAAAHIAERLRAYRETYRAYVARQIESKGVSRTPLDPNPRVVLIPGLGVVTAGRNRKAARIAADLYEHTVHVIECAETVGRYQALPEGDIFDMEYWSLEQAKLGKQTPKPFAGRVVYVTGAAHGIGAATARAFATEGAHLHLVDRDAEAVERLANELDATFDAVDITAEDAVRRSVTHAVHAYGGLDGVVSNAGAAPQASMHACSADLLRRSFELNFFAHQWVSQAAVEVFRAQQQGGFLLYNASKSAFNPGPGFGPYALPKAGVIALMKQYAVEGGEHGIRAGAVNADRVRTGLLSKDDVARRAAARGLGTDEYFQSNLLRQEVTVDHVARAFVALAQAERTTGCVLSVDGGNIAASPR